jgi:hypothetical protein
MGVAGTACLVVVLGARRKRATSSNAAKMPQMVVGAISAQARVQK